MKILKYTLFALGGFIVLIGAALAYVAATFDPNQYKPQIIQMVKEKKNRTLKLDGDIKLAFWPRIGANLGRLSLSEFNSEKEFATVEGVRVALDLMPLLSRQLVVNEVAVKSARADIVRHKDGRMNIDDLLAKDDEKGEQFKFDIDRVLIENAAINFRDEAKGTQYALTRVNLKTGRVAPGVPTKTELSFALSGNQPKFDLEMAVKTQLTFDLDQQALTLENLNLRATGGAADFTNITLTAGGNVSANLKRGEYAADKLTATLTGANGKENLDLKLDAPKLAFTSAKASGDKLLVTAKIKGPQRAITANLSVPGIEGTAQAFHGNEMTLELDARQGDQDIKAKMTSPIAGNLEAQQVSLSKLAATLTVTGTRFPGKGVSADLRGSASVDGRRQVAAADLAGKIADSKVTTKLGLSHFQEPAVTFDVDVDQLDVDRYLMPQPAGAQGQTAAAQKPSEQPFDLSALKDLRANGTLRIGSLKAANVKASKVRLDIGAANGRLNANPLSASLYQGKIDGALAVDANGAMPHFAAKQTLTGVSIGPLLKDLGNYDVLEGRGNVTLDVTSQGNTVTALKKALNGTAAVKLADGAVRGINIASSIREAKAKLGALQGEHTQAADKSQKTDFSELTGTFTITNGVARNNDLAMKSPLLRVGGEGDINLGEDHLNYLVKASIVGTTKGQGGRELGDLKGITVPVRVAGPFAAPSYKLDFGAMVSDTAKQEVAQAVRGQLEKRAGGSAEAKGDAATKDAPASGGGTRDKLRGLFGR